MTQNKKSDRILILDMYFKESLAKAIKTDRKGDIQLFINSTVMLFEAVKEYESFNVQSPIIKVAFNQRFNEKFEELLQLRDSLVGRGML
jgi:hypothetical protein